MSEFFREALDEPVPMEGYTPVAIQAASAPALPPRAEPEGPGSICGRWLNPGQTSRLPAALPTRSWRVRWEATLGGDAAPQGIQVGAERSLVQCESLWALVDDAGELVEHGSMGPGDLLMDTELGSFYSQTSTEGRFAGYALESGEEVFTTLLTYAQEFERTYTTRLAGNRLAILGVHRPMHPDFAVPDLSGLEVFALGAPLDVDGVKILRSGVSEALLVHKSRGLKAVRSGERLVVAVENALYHVNERLEFVAGMVGAFEPRSLSVDEAGRIHLIVDAPEGHALWVLSPEGERLLSFVIPSEAGPSVAPPIVGYDHAIYLLTESTAFALRPDGELRWEFPLGASLGGAAVTVDDQLLIAAGEAVFTVEEGTDADGQPELRRNLVTSTPGHRLGTAPILTADGRLLVASDDALLCLEPEV